MYIIAELTRIITNIFILVMLFWMVFWDSELNNPVKKYWMPKMKPVFLWLGLTAEWKMFSPDPFLYNSWPILKIFLQDGGFFLWEPTQGTQLNFIQKIRYKKSHKFYHEVGKANASFYTKVDFITYILHKHGLNDQCAKVEVYRVHQNIRPFDKQSDAGTPRICKQLVYTYNPPKQSVL